MAITISYPKAQAAAPMPKADPAPRASTELGSGSTPDPHESRSRVSKTEAVAVSKNTGALTNAEHQARWRKAHPGEHAAQQRAARARRKAGKVAS